MGREIQDNHKDMNIDTCSLEMCLVLLEVRFSVFDTLNILKIDCLVLEQNEFFFLLFLCELCKLT